MEYQETWFRSLMMAQESEEKSCHLFLQYGIVRRRVGRLANNSISFNRRQGIEEALKQVDGSSETVVNTLREYVVMNSTLKSILQQVKVAFMVKTYRNRFLCFLENLLGSKTYYERSLSIKELSNC